MKVNNSPFLRRLACAIGLVAATFVLNLPAQAEENTKENAQAAVPSVGVMHEIADAHEKPDPSLHYKLVVDVKTMTDDLGAASPHLQALGGLINTYRKYGVPADHMQVTAVFHGPTILFVTRDATYSRRTGISKNPNLKLLQELAAAGVQLVVCGQSARGQHYVSDDLIPSAQLNFSATVTFINLQTRGFVKVDW